MFPTADVEDLHTVGPLNRDSPPILTIHVEMEACVTIAGVDLGEHVRGREADRTCLGDGRKRRPHHRHRDHRTSSCTKFLHCEFLSLMVDTLPTRGGSLGRPVGSLTRADVELTCRRIGTLPRSPRT